METVLELGDELDNINLACKTLGLPRATLYRHLKPSDRAVKAPRPESPRALLEETRQTILDYLHNEEFVDRSPHAGEPGLMSCRSSECRLHTRL